MFSVYIKNYLDSNGNYVTTEKKMFAIPTTNEDGVPVASASVSSNEGAADSFTFTMNANSPYYNSMVHLKTLIRITYDEDVIFYGRVLTESKSTILQTKEIRCEGALSFLNDTFYEGVKEELLKEISITDYFKKIIDNHNTFIGTSADLDWKKVNKGTVSFNPTSEKRKYEPTSWTDSASLIKSLASDYGGYIKARYKSGKVYLDWYRYFYRDLGSGKRPTIKLGKNLIDFSNNKDVDNIFTRLIPVGGTKKDGSTVYVENYTYTDKNGEAHKIKTKYIPVKLMTSLFSNSELDEGFHNHNDYSSAESDYTPIYKPQSFPNADTQEKLWKYAVDFIKNNYYKAASTYTVKAIEMRVLDSPTVTTEDRSPKIFVGDVVEITYPVYNNGVGTTEKRALVCKAVQYDLLNPDKNSYTFGIPTEMLDHEYGVKTKDTKVNKPHGSGNQNQGISQSSAGGGWSPPEDDGPLTFEKVARMIGNQDNPPYSGTAAYDSFMANGPMSGSIYCYDPNLMSNVNVSQHPEDWIMTTVIGRTTKYGVGFAQGVGIFAFTWSMGVPKKILHYYTKYGADDKTTFEGVDPIGGSVELVEQNQGGVSGWVTKITASISGVLSKFNIGELLDSAGKNKGYNITLNETKTYKDANGVTRTKDGFVKAVDITTADYPSLSVGVLTAKSIAVESLEAASAIIQDLTTDTANARNLFANNLKASRLNVTTEIDVGAAGLGTVKSNSFAYKGVSGTKYLESCFTDFYITRIGSNLIFTMTGANGVSVQRSVSIG